ncbi:MAG: FtsK/SpoIIIE domain-containing protein, partial [Patulibacter minatonensis]
GVVDVAQRGRSLGVHVVLATQRPGGAVTDNIRANMSLRVALRVAGAAESDDVIGVPDAARLPRSIPGRAIARTSPTDLETFQAGYVGGLTAAAGSGARVEVRDRVKRPTITTQGGTPVANEVTDLELLVTAIDDATTAAGVVRPESPWRPPLPTVLALPEPTGGEPAGVATIGLVDEPTRQRQVPYDLDLPAAGNLLVYGGSGAGKTTVLRTIACALAERTDPSLLHIYGLDFAGLGLRSLEALPHVGSIIPGDDAERLARLLAVLRRSIDARARQFASARVSDLDAYNRAHPDAPLPRLVVLLDSYGGFTDAYERVDLGAYVDAIPRLVADGRAAGVHFVISADRRGAIPMTLGALISERVVLRMASEDELSMLGVDVRSLKGVKLPPGRGFLSDGRDLQVAVAGGSSDPGKQSDAIAALGAHLCEGTAARATPIAMLPEAVSSDVLVSELPFPADGSLRARRSRPRAGGGVARGRPLRGDRAVPHRPLDGAAHDRGEDARVDPGTAGAPHRAAPQPVAGGRRRVGLGVPRPGRERGTPAGAVRRAPRRW